MHADKPIRVLLADQLQLFRHGVSALLAQEADIQIVGECSHEGELLVRVLTLQPDVVCLEVGMLSLNGVELIRELLTAQPKVRILGLAANIEWHQVRKLMKSGGRGFVSKAADPVELAKAIRSVFLEERLYLCPEVTTCVMAAVFGDDVEMAVAATLTAREQQVLECIARGMTSPEIAQHLGLRLATVRGYRSNIMRNLDLHSGSDLTRYAIRNGLVSNGAVACSF